jgi:hypothetical protein
LRRHLRRAEPPPRDARMSSWRRRRLLRMHADGKPSDPMAGLLDGHDRARIQRLASGSQDRPQPLDDVRRPRVPQAEDKDADGMYAGERGDLPKVQVEGQDDSPLADRLGENLFSPPCRPALATRRPSRCMNLFQGEPSGVGESLLEVLPLDVRIVRGDLLERRDCLHPTSPSAPSSVRAAPPCPPSRPGSSG